MILTYAGQAAQAPALDALTGVGFMTGATKLRLTSGPSSRVTLTRLFLGSIDGAPLAFGSVDTVDVDASSPVLVFAGPCQGPRYPPNAVTSIAPHARLREVAATANMAAHVESEDLTKQLTPSIGTQRVAACFVAIVAGSVPGTYVFEESQ